MGWREDLQPASWRGVPFGVRAAETESGRRWAVHELPFAENPVLEDVGRRARRWTIDAFVVGNDYNRKRDALQAACDKPGPGELIHPYLGSLQAVCEGIRIRESSREGGLAQFQLTFVESGAPSAAEEVAGPELADEAADRTIEASGEELEQEAQTEGVTQEAIDGLEEGTSLVEDALAGVEELEGELDDVAAWTEDLASLADPYVALATAPFDIAQKFNTTLAKARGAIGARLAALDIFAGWLFQDSSSLDRPLARGAMELQAEKNAKAVVRHFKAVVAAEAVRTAANTEWESFEQATAMRATLLEGIDALAEGARTDALFRELLGLKSALSRTVPPPAEDLPRLKTVLPGRTVPSIVLAYEEYGNASREGTLVLRNRPPHPAFMAAGEPVEVLVDA